MDGRMDRYGMVWYDSGLSVFVLPSCIALGGVGRCFWGVCCP